MAKVTKIGGQAVIEGVMMRGEKMYAIAVRHSSGNIVVEEKQLSDKYKRGFWKAPIVRGAVAFFSSLILGLKIITRSAEMSGLDEVEKPSKFEIWLTEKLGDKLDKILMGLSIIIAIFLALFLFTFIPVFVANLFRDIVQDKMWIISTIEGTIRMVIFLLYMYFISKMEDIKRTFMYHGAEHKTISCFEAEEELNIENVRKYSTIHKRCGTSFLFIVMFISIIFFMFVPNENIVSRIISHIIFVPVVAGISYEILRLSSKSNSKILNIFVYPGMVLQRLTTLEPDDSMIEVAIASMNKVLENQEG